MCTSDIDYTRGPEASEFIYQELYGTVVYFFQFFFNRKDKRIARAHVLGVVLPANGIWIALPALGMWASARMILDGSLAVVR